MKQMQASNVLRRRDRQDLARQRDAALQLRPVLDARRRRTAPSARCAQQAEGWDVEHRGARHQGHGHRRGRPRQVRQSQPRQVAESSARDGAAALLYVHVSWLNGSMPTSASSAPGTPGSPPRGGCGRAASRWSSSRRVTASAAGSGRSSSPTARPSTAAARGSRRITTRSSRSRPRSACRRTRRGSRARTCSSTATARAATRASSRRSARSRCSRSRCAQCEDRPDGEAGSARRAVDREACRGVGRANRWRRTLEHVRDPHRASAATCSRWRCAGCSPATSTTCRSCTCCSSCAAHGSINTLFSIEKGAQENLVEGGAGSIAQRVADELGDAVRLQRAGAVDHAATTTASSSTRGDARRVGRAHAVVTVPPALALDIAFDPALPDDRPTLYRNAVAGPGVEDARRLRRAVLAGRRVQRPDRPSPARRPR